MDALELTCAQHPRDHGAGAPYIALVVDDQPELVTIMAAALRAAGWKTVAANGVAAALAAAREHSICLLVTDYQMPDATGEDLIRQVRRTSPGLPCVLVSGTPDKADLAHELRAAFVDKPFHPGDLLSAVASARYLGPGGAAPAYQPTVS